MSMTDNKPLTERLLSSYHKDLEDLCWLLMCSELPEIRVLLRHKNRTSIKWNLKNGFSML